MPKDHKSDAGSDRESESTSGAMNGSAPTKLS
jgi:hypothetical protein